MVNFSEYKNHPVVSKITVGVGIAVVLMIMGMSPYSHYFWGGLVDFVYAGSVSAQNAEKIQAIEEKMDNMFKVVIEIRNGQEILRGGFASIVPGRERTLYVNIRSPAAKFREGDRLEITNLEGNERKLTTVVTGTFRSTNTNNLIEVSSALADLLGVERDRDDFVVEIRRIEHN